MAADKNGTPREATKTDKPLSAYQRAIHQAMGEGRVFGADDDPYAERYPLLWELMSTVEVGRDRIKEPSSLRVQLGPGGVLLTLGDRSFKYAWDAGCRHLGEIFDAMEARLADVSRPPRVVGKGEPEIRKRKSRD